MVCVSYKESAVGCVTMSKFLFFRASVIPFVPSLLGIPFTMCGKFNIGKLLDINCNNITLSIVVLYIKKKVGKKKKMKKKGNLHALQAIYYYQVLYT